MLTSTITSPLPPSITPAEQPWALLDRLPFDLTVNGTGGNCRELSGSIGGGCYLALTDGDGDLPTSNDVYAYVARDGETEPIAEHSGWAGIGDWLESIPWATDEPAPPTTTSTAACGHAVRRACGHRDGLEVAIRNAGVLDLEASPEDYLNDPQMLDGAIIALANLIDCSTTGLPPLSVHITADEEKITGSMLLCLHTAPGVIIATYLKPRSLVEETDSALDLFVGIAQALIDEAEQLLRRAR